MRVSVVLFAGLLAAVLANESQAQQFPPTEEERIFPNITRVPTVGELLPPRPVQVLGRPVWYVPLGTIFKFRQDRLILPYTSKYAMGAGIMANQYFYINPSGDERVLSSTILWKLERVGGVHASKIYSAHLLQPRHTIYMLWTAEGGKKLEIEICPGGEVTPTVGQFTDYFEITLPEVVTIE